MVDCGAGSSDAYREVGLAPDDIDHVFLSHAHSDHVGGFSMLIQGLWVERRRRPLVVHAPARVITAVRSWLEATLLFDELIGFPILWRALGAGVVVEGEGWECTPFATTHLASLHRAFGTSHGSTSFEAFGFEFRVGGRRLGHTADIGALSDLDPLLASPIDLLVCEAAHVELDGLMDRLSAARVEHVAFVHLEARLWNERDRLLKLAGERLPETRCSVPGDRMFLPLH